MILSTTNIDRPYDVLDVVFVVHGQEAGGFLGTGGIDMNSAMTNVKKLLIEKAKGLGADAIVGCDFEQRIAVNPGMVNKQVLEIFAFGTAVKFK